MLFKHKIGALAALALVSQFACAAELAPKPTVSDIIKESKPADWRALDPENTFYMELPAGRVIIEMAPDFAPQNAANIRALARETHYDGLFIIRSQDNYEVQ